MAQSIASEITLDGPTNEEAVAALEEAIDDVPMDEVHPDSHDYIVNDIIVRFAAEGGDGSMSTGEFFGVAVKKLGLEILKITSLPAEIKGGPAMIQIRVGEGQPKSQGSHLDVLVCFNDEVYQINKADLKPNGVLITDPECQIDETNQDATKIEIPFAEIAKREAGGALAKNMVALGAIAGLLEMDIHVFIEMIHTKWDRKGEKVVGNNLAGLQAGYDFVQGHKHEMPFRIETRPYKDTLLMGGNDAIALGALASGLGVFAGYPITPASTILEKLALLMPKFGGKVIQCEDEIASLGCVLGASYAGLKAATSTSGPGVSLMVEEIGLASMAEIPCVIFDAQRGGPSTGLPTKQEQSDLNLAIYGAHGDAPRIVLAPANVKDCYELTIEAFNLSEMCQMPALFLTDFYLAQCASTLPPIDPASYQIINRLRPNAEELENYNRFKLTENGVSPMAKPLDDATFYIATGLEHNEKGNPDISPAAHRKMSDKRHKKLQLAVDYALENGRFARTYGDDDAELGLISWGSTEGAVQEAIDIARRHDLKVAHLHLLLLNPLPDKTIYDWVAKRNRVVVCELNYTGQLAQRLRAALNIQLESFTKCIGQPFTPYELLSQILYYHGWETGRSEPILSQVALVQKQRQAAMPRPGHDGQNETMGGTEVVREFDSRI